MQQIFHLILHFPVLPSFHRCFTDFWFLFLDLILEKRYNIQFKLPILPRIMIFDVLRRGLISSVTATKDKRVLQRTIKN